MSDFDPPDPREPDEEQMPQTWWESDLPDPDVPDERDPIEAGIREAAILRRLLDEYPTPPSAVVPLFVPALMATAGLVGLASVWLFDNGQGLSFFSYAAGLASVVFAASFLRDNKRALIAAQEFDARRQEWGPHVKKHALRLAGIAQFIKSRPLLERWADVLDDISDFAIGEGEFDAAELTAYARARVLDRLPFTAQQGSRNQLQ